MITSPFFILVSHKDNRYLLSNDISGISYVLILFSCVGYIYLLTRSNYCCIYGVGYEIKKLLGVAE